jgi:hypothetical protein
MNGYAALNVKENSLFFNRNKSKSFRSSENDGIVPPFMPTVTVPDSGNEKLLPVSKVGIPTVSGNKPTGSLKLKQRI